MIARCFKGCVLDGFLAREARERQTAPGTAAVCRVRLLNLLVDAQRRRCGRCVSCLIDARHHDRVKVPVLIRAVLRRR